MFSDRSWGCQSGSFRESLNLSTVNGKLVSKLAHNFGYPWNGKLFMSRNAIHFLSCKTFLQISNIHTIFELSTTMPLYLLSGKSEQQKKTRNCNKECFEWFLDSVTISNSRLRHVTSRLLKRSSEVTFTGKSMENAIEFILENMRQTGV